MECIFCKIASGQIPADIVMESKELVAFRDINPQAPVHILLIPRKHVAAFSEAESPELLLSLLEGARKLAVQLNLGDYRLVINNGAGAGQTVFHLHLHILSGREMGWPPG